MHEFGVLILQIWICWLVVGGMLGPLVECSGDARIFRSRPVDFTANESIDWKLDLLVQRY